MRLLLILVLLLAGCDDRFRYACQDPKHWADAQCQRPQCAVAGTCPDLLLRPQDLKEQAQ